MGLSSHVKTTFWGLCISGGEQSLHVKTIAGMCL